MSTGSDEPNHGREYPPLENSARNGDPYAPVDYPTESGPPPNYGAPTDFQQAGYPPPPPGYPQAGYPPPGYPQAGYPPPGMPPGYPPQYQGGYGYDPYASARPAGTNGKAIAALVTSLSGLVLCGVPSIVGLILGIIAMREVKRTGQEGHGFALAAVIVGALSVVGWIAYFVIIVVAIAVTSTPTTYGY
ncbi:DUF4190 domain-containing protein [Mycolicibacterium sp. P1-18]|uniref:DUF4190 domain-containing protein n=1 Tax=Mycolicibacterium sp. P1-18 TaxID=2024615 RepID=UPI0011F1E373|nr:DUF4190 domain-containing protein [Mycolicibacterium sp. P1-18]KAA0095269.1 DUF4190 domain-containing protein [Mycolicibacterium sp. P1-18]